MINPGCVGQGSLGAVGNTAIRAFSRNFSLAISALLAFSVGAMMGPAQPKNNFLLKSEDISPRLITPRATGFPHLRCRANVR